MMPSTTGSVVTLNDSGLASELLATETVTVYSLCDFPSSAVTVYLTGWEKSCSAPLAGETVAPSDTSMVGTSLVTSVPRVTVTAIVRASWSIVAGPLCSSNEKAVMEEAVSLGCAFCTTVSETGVT